MLNQRASEESPIPRERRGWRAIDTLVIAIFVLFLALCATIALHKETYPTQKSGDGPPPSLFVWSYQATRDSATPQDAYAAGMSLRSCLNAPNATRGSGGAPRSATVTWLVSSPNYGLARIQTVCDAPGLDVHTWLFELFRNSTGSWSPQGGYNAVHWSAGPTVVAPPSWLSLPSDTYERVTVEQPGIGEHPEVSVMGWDAQSRLFVFGHIADPAAQPTGARSVLVNGTPGWMIVEHDMATVTETLPDGTSLFFSGIATPASVQALAAEAFAHANEALEPLSIPTSPTTTATP